MAYEGRSGSYIVIQPRPNHEDNTTSGRSFKLQNDILNDTKSNIKAFPKHFN